MRVVSCFVCASAVMLCALAASAAPLTNPLPPDQVTCDELQLERLALRVATLESGADFAHPSLLLWRSGQGGGGYSGLTVTDGISGTPGHLLRAETQLSFDLTLHPPTDTLNPGRRLLPQGSLALRDPA